MHALVTEKVCGARQYSSALAYLIFLSQQLDYSNMFQSYYFQKTSIRRSFKKLRKREASFSHSVTLNCHISILLKWGNSLLRGSRNCVELYSRTSCLYVNGRKIAVDIIDNSAENR